MKKLMAVMLTAVLLLGLAGCCKEHQWQEADCENPRTCLKCGETEGEPLDHDWQDATCEKPRTCARCGAEEGEALGHDWQDATCREAKTCRRCGATEGKPLGHNPGEWKIRKVDLEKSEKQMEVYCKTCGELVEKKSVPLETMFEDGTFYFNAGEFINRMESCLSVGYDCYALQKDLHNEYLSWNAYVREDVIGAVGFTDAEGEMLLPGEKEERKLGCVVLAFPVPNEQYLAWNLDSMLEISAAAVQACRPGANLTAAETTVGLLLGAVGRGEKEIVEDGLAYGMNANNTVLYIMIAPAEPAE